MSDISENVTMIDPPFVVAIHAMAATESRYTFAALERCARLFRGLP